MKYACDIYLTLCSFMFTSITLFVLLSAGVVTVLVVNHMPNVEAIERFTFNPEKPGILVHEETIVSDSIIL